MERRIVGFHTDAEDDWVAALDCGHTRHVRHRPPWFSRPWVIDPEQRAAAIGTPMDCVKCDRGEPVPTESGVAGNQGEGGTANGRE